MAMIKTVSPAGWAWDRPVVQMIKMSSRGLTGGDRAAFLKTAGVHPSLLAAVDRMQLHKDEVPVHSLALGATEFWHSNRNGDGFKEATCRQHHDSFVKHARWFRNHQNRDPKLSYGVIKASAYNEDMHRVELLAALNAEKSAADRNGGLIADKELEKLARGEDIPTSMACKIAFDVCSGCGHKSRTRDEYCRGVDQGGTCKYGGCRDNLGKVAADGHVLHVDNPNPLWFDESYVYRGADRTAFASQADWLHKAAGDISGNVGGTDGGRVIGGAEMAERLGVTAPLHLMLGNDPAVCWSEAVLGQLKLARGLAALEQVDGYAADADRHALNPAARTSPTDAQLLELGAPGSDKSAAMLAALGDRGVVLPLAEFARWTFKSASAADVAAAAGLLPALYGRLVGRGDIEQRVTASPFSTWHLAKSASASQLRAADALAPSFSLLPGHAAVRAMHSQARGGVAPTFKTAADTTPATPAAASLADAYGLYQLAALHRCAGANPDAFDLTARLAVSQNKV